MITAHTPDGCMCECLNLCVCAEVFYINICMFMCMSAKLPTSASLPLCPFSSNRVVATVSMGLDAPDNQKAHTTETLLVLNTHQSQLSNPQAGRNGPQSVKHKTCRPFTVKHMKLLETGRARHMLSK